MSDDRVIRAHIYNGVVGALRCMASGYPRERHLTRFELNALAMWVACAARDGYFELAQVGGICLTELELMRWCKDWQRKACIHGPDCP